MAGYGLHPDHTQRALRRRHRTTCRPVSTSGRDPAGASTSIRRWKRAVDDWP